MSTDHFDNKQPEKKKNYVELTEQQILKQAKDEITSIQEKLANQRITIDEAKKELQKINERLQAPNLDNNEKNKIWKTFDKLNKLEQNIDENNLKTEVNEIIKSLEKLINLELNNLKFDIQNQKNYIWKWQNSRSADVQQWIKKSKTSIINIIKNATQDSNLIARIIWILMARLNK